MKNFPLSLRPSLIGCALVLLSFLTSYAQQGFSTPIASQNGFVLKKTTTNTTIQSGVDFSYNIDFTIPAGATNVVVSDVLPPPLTFQALTFTASCGGAPVPATPAVGTNGTVSLTFASVPSTCTGSMCITVQFPNGTTCNGTIVHNRACIQGALPGLNTSFCTDTVSTTAQAVNPWHINKTLISNSPTPSCSNTMVNDTARYQFCVYKSVGTTGQLNLFNATVTDLLPTGASIVPGSSNCPFTTTMVNNPQQQQITWNIGALSALPQYNSKCCQFSVYYPVSSFPNGTTITNTATLSGSLGSPNFKCDSFTQNSNTTSYQVTVIPKSKILKWVNTTGQPGCKGRYTIYVCNDGAVTLNTFTITDNLPNTLTGYTVVSHSSNVFVNIQGGVLTGTSTAPLPPGGSVTIVVEFTIPLTATVNSTITNCASFSSPQLGSPVQACVSFVVKAPSPKPCLWKEVCQKKPSYLPGSIVRYRLRVQNIGGLAMTGTTVTDQLPHYLSLAPTPNMVYYTSSNWNMGACVTSSSSLPPGATAWTGVMFTGSVNNLLTWTLPPIAASCQNFFYVSCGLYGTAGVPFYYIEFDVIVNDDAPIGVVPNNFTLKGGNLPATETSNTDYINIVGSAGYTLTKSITTPSSSTVAPGSMVTYRLQFNPTGTVSLRHLAFVDLLPRNNGPADRRILAACGSRGSSFDLTYDSYINSWIGPSLVTVTQRYDNANTVNPTLNPTTFGSVNGNYFSSSCSGNSVTWITGTIPATKKNFGFYFGALSVPPGSYARTEFKAQVPSSVSAGQVACNSFVANAAKLYLINSTALQDIAMTEQESNNVCITTGQPPFTCRDTLIQPNIDGLCCTYTATLQNLSGSGITQILWNATIGTVQSASATGCSNTVNVATPTSGSINFSPTCNANPVLSFNGTGGSNNWVSITLSIIHATGDTCRVGFRYQCQPSPQKRCDSISYTPFVYTALNASGRTFTVHNLKIPNSPICWIDIKVGTLIGQNFTQLPWWLGGGMTLPNTSPPNNSAQFNSINGAYTRLPSNQTNINVPTNQNVSFNLGVDKTYINTGNVVVRFVVHHCDGDSCSYQINWGPPINPCPLCPKIIDTSYTERVFAKQIALEGNGDRRLVKFVAFKIPEGSDAEIFATSAETADPEEAASRNLAVLNSAVTSPKTALFEFATPVSLARNQRTPLINMVFAKSLPNLYYTLYDENGDEIITDTIKLATGLIQAPQNSTGKARIFPNPAQNEVIVEYELLQGSNVKVDLYNVNGQHIRRLDNSQRDAGTYQTRFRTEGVAKGAYFVRIMSNGFAISLPLMIQ